ncbi:integral inner membrane protein of type IV secretion complex (VirB6) [Bartonella kosoyi]|uniref:Integral inner membrane protein of type IV secretion complex (VirB6) n=1 Tax=Bartonella kosoyi TaxID=2133959 RepID=A0A5B9CUJ6_9HYPH|nr:integral inner membrane protein of type IV secretion complex (VirB6) [Bartonella kosoyi]
MAVDSKGIFSYIDNMLTEPLTKTMDSIYCALAAQLKEIYASYTTFMARLCRCPRFIITGYKKPIT